MDILPILAALKRQKTAAALIAIEIALSCAIICNALFLITNRLERSAIPSGVAESELVSIRTAGLGEEADADARSQSALATLATVPGVKAATLLNQVPFGHSSWNSGLRLQRDDRNSVVSATTYFADETTLKTLGLKLVAGREFNADEFTNLSEILADPDGVPPHVSIITKALGKTLFGNNNPLGREFYYGEEPIRVIGIVEHLVRPSITDDATADASLLMPSRVNAANGYFVIRTDPAQREQVLKAVKKSLAESMPNRIVLDSKSFEQLRADNFKQDRVMAGLLIAVVVSLLIVTALGIVGLASFWVQRRRRQIGIRRALGATRAQILHYFQTENFLIVTVGIVLGMIAAYAISGWLMHQYELPRLPAYYLPVGAIALWLLGQLSVLAPALRAASVPPATATRTV